MTDITVAPDQIEDIIPPVSNSEIQTFIDCRRKWFLQNVLQKGPKVKALAGALALGTRVHTALERMYENGEDPVEVFEELHSKVVYDLLVQEIEQGFIDQDLRKKVQSERELGTAMLEGYVAWASENGIDEGLRIAGVEATVIVASGIPGVRLRGKLDQRVYREVDGARLFRDFKTAANLTDGPAMLPIDEQMKFYMLLERLDAMAKTGGQPPEPTMGGLYTMLKKVKRTARAQPPFYGQVEIHHNDRELESMWIRTHKRLSDMLEARQQLEAGGDHRYWVYPRPSRDCSWKCPFTAICPMMDDSSDETWQALLNEHFIDIDPNERYHEDETKS